MGFEAVAAQIDTWVADGTVHGAAIAVWHRGDLAVTRYIGEAQPNVPVTESTLFGLASLSKPITAAAFMAVSDEGLLDLDTVVVDVLPEFGANVDPLHANAMLEAQRDTITFRQLLSHTSGLPENVSSSLYDPSTLPSRDEQIDAMLQTPLESAPGERLRYSNLGAGIAARAVEVVTGTDFPTVIEQKILQPMNLRNIVVVPGSDYDDRIATLQDPANPGTDCQSYNSAWWRSTGLPWGGYYGTTEDMIRFLTSFLPGEESVLSDESITAMTTDQVKGLEGGVESMHAMWDRGYWGVGLEMKGTKSHHWSGTKTSRDTWVHWGFAGTLAWVDPTRELGVAVFANRSVLSMWPFRPPRWATLSDALCDAADEMA